LVPAIGPEKFVKRVSPGNWLQKGDLMRDKKIAILRKQVGIAE